MLRGGEADVRRFRSGADRTTAYQERRVGTGYVAVVGAGNINNIENKKSLPAMQSFFYICEYLGVTPKEFFDDENADPTALREFIQEARRLDEKSLEYILGIMKKLNSRK